MISGRPKRPAATPLDVAGIEWPLPIASAPQRRRRRSRRGLSWLALVVAAVECVLLAWLSTGSAFAVRRVDVEGTQRVSKQQVLRAAGLDHAVSVFQLRPGAIAGRLEALPLIRSASTTVELPDRVVLRVREWDPVAIFKAGAQAKPMLLSQQGTVIGPAVRQEPLLQVTGPAAHGLAVGTRAVDPRLLSAMLEIKRNFAAIVPGQTAGSYELDGCGNLTLTTDRGWKVYFGRVLTPEEFAQLEDKLSALKSVAADPQANLGAPDLDYVNLMNPSLPAVHRRSSPPPAPKPAATAPAPPPAATPAPAIQVRPCG